MRALPYRLFASSLAALIIVAGCTGTSNTTSSPAAIATPVPNFTEPPTPAPNLSGFVLAGAGTIDSSMNYTSLVNPAPCGVSSWLGGAWQAITFGSFGTFPPQPSPSPDIFDRTMVWSGVYSLSNGDSGQFFVRAPKVVATPAPASITAGSTQYEQNEVTNVTYGTGGCATFTSVALGSSGGSGKINLDNGVSGSFTLGPLTSQSASRQPRAVR